MAEVEDRCRQIRCIQELFHGRFTESEVRILLEAKDWDTNLVLDFIFSSESSEVRQLIEARLGDAQGGFQSRFQEALDLNEAWTFVGADRRHICKTSRQFACPSCDRSWWKKVPKRKMVSKCFRCKKKFDALPREKEWGWAEFHCECGKVFGGFCQRITSSPCHECNLDVYPCRIVPPRRGGSDVGSERGRQTVDTHRCNAPDCVYKLGNKRAWRRGRGTGRGQHNPPALPPGINGIQRCVHPRNLGLPGKPRAVVPSPQHVSSGSTIDTCLTQDDLLDMVSVIDDIGAYRETPGLPQIPEESKNNDSNNGDSSSSES